MNMIIDYFSVQISLLKGLLHFLYKIEDMIKIIL